MANGWDDRSRSLLRARDHALVPEAGPRLSRRDLALRPDLDAVRVCGAGRDGWAVFDVGGGPQLLRDDVDRRPPLPRERVGADGPAPAICGASPLGGRAVLLAD